MHDPEPKRPPYVAPVIIFSQFAGTSLWFAGNAVMKDLQAEWSLPDQAIGWMTSSVQLGFITGTLVFAYLALADRVSSRLLFLVSALLGALFNLGIYLADGLWSLMLLRFVTGTCLAGIYPVGMKIAAGWYKGSLGKALGFLVGALVVGTALPHGLKALGQSAPWEQIILAVSAVAAVGGVLMFLLVPDGPYRSKAAPMKGNPFRALLESARFRSAALGYFGHMWELYTFWTFIPVILLAKTQEPASAHVSFWSFAIIGAGAFGCSVGGILSQRFGSAHVAAAQLIASGACCLLAPLVFSAPEPLFLAFLLFWGVVVVGDSPQFSTLNARTAPPELIGSGLTLVTSVGFALTIASIELFSALVRNFEVRALLPILAVGPLLGLIALRPLLGAERSGSL